jgi:hypothetical protein
LAAAATHFENAGGRRREVGFDERPELHAR